MDPTVSKRSLVALVGTESNGRTELARALLRGGQGVIICSGPPGCPLLRGDECPIIDGVDGVVVMPTLTDASEEVAIGLTRCAFESRTAIAIEPAAVHPLSRAAHVPAGLPDEMAGAIRDLIIAR